MVKVCKSVLCIFALLILIICSACGKTEYSVRDFADISVVGYTEHGSLSIKVSDAAVNRIYADGKKDKTAALRFAETFRFSYEGQNENDSYFTNGDVVTINVSYDEGMARDLGVTFVDSSFDYTIEGLEDKVQLSPFDGLSVKFSGVAPYGTPQIDKSNCIQYVIDNVTFRCDNYDLSNGDKVVVYAEFNADIAERNGYVFTEDIKKFTVVGLPKYVTTMADVTYSDVTAKMRYMTEKFVEGSETAYKSLNWFFGSEDSDSDSDGYIDEEENDSDSELTVGFEDNEDQEEGENLFGESGDEDENGVIGENESNTVSSKKKKRKTNVQRIKDDFLLSDFKAKFEYTPVACYYSLNPLQYSDNSFCAVYKVKGIFVCEDTSGSGYINVGDTVVGEIYLTTSLTGGSVDIKNNLVYEESTLKNYHAYSIRSFPEYKDMTSDVFKSTTYVVETLEYYEDEETYDKFAADEEKGETHSKAEVSHINIESSSDSDSEKKKRSSDEESLETDTDTNTVYYDVDEDPTYYDEDNSEDLGDDNGGEYDGGFEYEYDGNDENYY